MILTELSPADEGAIDLLERVERLEVEIQEIRKDLRDAKIFSLQSKLDDLWDWVTDIDKRAIQTLQPKKRNQREQLIALMMKHDGKMMEADARKIMCMRKPQFSILLGMMKDILEVKPYHGDKRRNVIRFIKK